MLITQCFPDNKTEGRVNLGKPERKTAHEKPSKDPMKRKAVARTSIVGLESKFLFEEIGTFLDYSRF